MNVHDGQPVEEGVRRGPAAPAALSVAYLVSRFPKISETFILREIVALIRRGVDVRVFPLLRHREALRHADADAVMARVYVASVAAWVVLRDQGFWLRRAPGRYLDTWRRALAGNRRSPRFLVRALAVVPLAAHYARLMQAAGIHRIHAHWATHPALAAYCINRLTGIPYSVTVHAHDLFVDRAMLKVKLDAADFVVTVSDYNRRLLISLLGDRYREATRVIHCGVDCAMFCPPARRRPRAVPLLLCTGSLESYKGHIHLIDALALVRARGVRVRCVCIGAGPLRRRLMARVRKRALGGCIRFVGACPRSRVRAWLERATLFVLPSVRDRSGKMEGIPVALMEAMAMGIATVASDLSGVPELVRHDETGLLVPPADAGALAAALEHLLRNPAVSHRLGAAGRDWVVRRFNENTTVAELYDCLKAPPHQRSE